jgi:hypothetical protein
MTVHAFMADIGRESIKDGNLQRFLNTNRATILAGAMYPDGGYGTGDRELAEHAHWGEWTYDFIRYIRDDLKCNVKTLAGSTEPAPAASNPNQDQCAKLIAFMMGNAAHGYGDEVWDNLFEPQVRFRKESSAPSAPGSPFPFPGNPVSDLAGSIEYAMDVCAIVDHFRDREHPSGELPLSSHLQKVYAKHGLVFTTQQIDSAAAVTRSATQAEIAVANSECQRVRQQMPWASRHYYTESGGVLHVGKMIGGMYEYLWAQLQQPEGKGAKPRIVGVHPNHGETDAPFRKDDPALAIRAYMDGFVDPSNVEAQEHFCLFEAGGRKVAGTSTPGIYRRDFTHTLNFSPAQDLKPNTRYFAVITVGLIDELNQAPLRSFIWSFTTEPSVVVARQPSQQASRWLVRNRFQPKHRCHSATRLIRGTPWRH